MKVAAALLLASSSNHNSILVSAQAGGEPECHVCGENFSIGDPETVVDIDPALLPSTVPAGFTITCGIVDQGGKGGFFTEEDCTLIQSQIELFCMCLPDFELRYVCQAVRPHTHIMLCPLSETIFYAKSVIFGLVTHTKTRLSLLVRTQPLSVSQSLAHSLAGHRESFTGDY